MSVDNKVFGFSNQLSVGNLGEKLFLECYKSRNARKTDGRIYDCIVDNNISIELKTDSYSCRDTNHPYSANYFMERYGNIDKMTNGGPWRALADSVDRFVYLYIQEKTFFWFNPKTLCPLLDKIIPTLRPKTIKNKSWNTLGYAVPRDLCKEVCLAEECFE